MAKSQSRRYAKAFILEPILTPSSFLDTGMDDSSDGLDPEFPVIIDPTLDPLSPEFQFPEDPEGLTEGVEFLAYSTAVEDEMSSLASELNSELIEYDYFEEPNFPPPDVPLIPEDVQFTSGVFTVGETGQVSIDYLFDGGKYDQGELAIFSLEGMESEPGTRAFIQEAAQRALSNSELGYVVISDATDAARFSNTGGVDFNTGEYRGVQTFQMNAGDRFGFMLVPNQSIATAAEGRAWGTVFSMATNNPDDYFQFGQIADVTGDGNTFTLEDISLAGGRSDRDYDDIIFQVRGATANAPLMDEVLGVDRDWRTSPMGQALLNYAQAYTDQVDYSVAAFNAAREFQPLVGIIDTGFAANNPNLDYTNIITGSDFIDWDDNPFLADGEGDHHGTQVVNVIDGMNDNAPLWLGRAVGSGRWADSLVEFVDAAVESGQPNAVVNLSLDLTQIDANGEVFTRYEFTPMERAAIEYARQNNVLLVVAAGNDGGVMSALGQASQEFDNIITVGAAEQFDPNTSAWKGADRADYSSYGRGLDLMAYGGTSEKPHLSLMGDDLGGMAGTSVATAKVTGAVSQVWAANPALSYRQVIELLKQTATDLGEAGFDSATGAGLLNIMAAVQLAKATKPEEHVTPHMLIPETWSGEGVFTAGDRAASTLFMGKYYVWESYTIKSGDTLSQIASRTMGSGDPAYYNFIAQKNGIANPALIYAGTTILVPKQVAAPTPPPVQPAPVPNVPISSGSANYRDGRVNPFAYAYQGQCTWFTYGRMLETGLLPAAIKNNRLFLGHAGTWRADALKVGLPVTSTPTPGARGIVVWPPNVQGAGRVGHVAFLEEVYPDGRVRISESNWAGKGISERILTPAQYAGLSFVRLENAQTNNYTAPPAGTPGQSRQYIVQRGDTLWGIAQRLLGDGNRWREIMKTPTGGTFTEAEARLLQIGQSVYLPVTQQVGTGKPVTPAPAPQPTTVQSKPGYVNGNVGSVNLNMRSGASTGASVLRTLPRNASLKILRSVTGGTYTTPNGQTRSDWYEVEVNGQKGFVAAYYVTQGTPPPTSEPGYVNGNVGSVNLNLRSSASTSGGVIGSLSQNSRVTILRSVTGGTYRTPNGQTRSDWYEVEVNGKKGFVAAYYVTKGNPPNGGGSSPQKYTDSQTDHHTKLNALADFKDMARLMLGNVYFTATGGYLQDYSHLTQYYGGYKAFHAGFDIGTANGNSVYALTGGEVIQISYRNNQPIGVYVYNRQLDKTIYYAHVVNLSVSKGQSIVAGQRLGSITDGHLHFDVREGRKANWVDPRGQTYSKTNGAMVKASVKSQTLNPLNVFLEAKSKGLTK